MAFTFRLYLEDGTDAGDFVTAVPNWKPGDELYDDSHTRYAVVDVVDLTDIVDAGEESEHFLGALVVTPVRVHGVETAFGAD
jgi:hypothetical protein